MKWALLSFWFLLSPYWETLPSLKLLVGFITKPKKKVILSLQYLKFFLLILASGDSVDATQELLTLGLCNLFGSFASSMPITGSFSRSAVNHASGVQTPMGGVYTGE